MTNMVSAAPRMASVEIGGIASGEQDFITLDERMLKAYAQTAIKLGGDRSDVVQGIELTPGKLSDPAHLFALQQRIAEYSHQVALISAVTRKAVNAVETVMRA